MTVKIVCAGKIKDAFYRDACEEYGKRLSRYCTVEIAQVQDESTPDAPSPGERNRILQKEGERLLSRIRENEYVVALCIDGKEMDSPAFAARIDELAGRGRSALTFVIGGSLGLSQEVLTRADEKLSLSRMTMPHRLCRVVLLEQIYRAFKINAQEPYHK